jgi:GT2 family glycosyltransferase
MSMHSVALSIVSHGHSQMLPALLEDLRLLWQRRDRQGLEILLTLNLADEEHSYLQRFSDLPLRLHINPQPLGFGSNQNAAFTRCGSDFFAIVNPDIRMPALDLDRLLLSLSPPKVGAVAPRVVDQHGALQDSARRFPTVARLLWRQLTGQRVPDYFGTTTAIPVDWVAGMFVLFKREAWISVRGFDARYFMYFEDVDLCRRLHQQGWQLMYDPAATVQHDAQRASHRNARHLSWHLRSAILYFTSR